MSAPYNILRSKLARAIVAYLIEQGAGTAADISPARSRQPKGYPCTEVIPAISRPEVQFAAVRRITVHISIKGTASKATPGEGLDAARQAFDARCAATYDALLVGDGQSFQATADAITDAGRALAVADPTGNADLADFTVQAWYEQGEGEGTAEAEGCDWEEVLMFDAICCGSNVS